MPVSATPVFSQTPKAWYFAIGANNGTNLKTVLTGGANGTKIVAGIVTNSDSAKVVQLYRGLSLGTVTITIASPGVITTSSAHGLVQGDRVIFSTTDTLPTGITAGTTYFVISAGLTATAFQIATTAGGSAINTTGSQSGVHTLTSARLLTSTSVVQNAGVSGSVSTSNLFDPALHAGLPPDNDGALYTLINSGEFLMVGITAALTANTLITGQIIGSDF